jgi:hypothetical protein
MVYGFFLCVTSLLIWLGYRWDPLIFAESDVRLWRIFFYTVDVGVRGFAQDIMEYVGISSVLTPVGVMHHVDFLLKIVMAATIISGAAKYYDLVKGKAGALAS